MLGREYVRVSVSTHRGKEDDRDVSKVFIFTDLFRLCMLEVSVQVDCWKSVSHLRH